MHQRAECGAAGSPFMGEGNASRGEGVMLPRSTESSGSSSFSGSSTSLPVVVTAWCAPAVSAEYDVRRHRVSRSRSKRAAASSVTSAAALDQWTGEGGWGPTGSTEITSEAAAGQVASRAAVVPSSSTFTTRAGSAMPGVRPSINRCSGEREVP